MKKSVMVSGMYFAAEFLTGLYKEVVKRGGDEEMIFEALKTGSDMVSKFAEMIVGAKKEAEAVVKSLAFIADISVAAQAFTKESFFGENGPAQLHFWSNFKSWVLDAIPAVPAFKVNLKKFQLTRYMYDKEILDELGQPKPFTVPEFAAIIRDLILKQPNGEDGVLLNNGCANIFYVVLPNARVVAVPVDWVSAYRDWDFDAYALDDDGWDDGRCAFSRG